MPLWVPPLVGPTPQRLACTRVMHVKTCWKLGPGGGSTINNKHLVGHFVGDLVGPSMGPLRGVPRRVARGT